MQSIPEKPLAINHIRPRFVVETATPIEEISSRITNALSEEGSTCIGYANSRYAMITIPEIEQHYWSPQLKISMEELEDGKIEVRGVYGPRPAVWTMFVFFYFFIFVSITVIGIIGMSMMTLDKPANILWFIPILLLVFGSLFLSSHFGKMKGRSQIIIIHKFFEEKTGIPVLPRNRKEE